MDNGDDEHTFTTLDNLGGRSKREAAKKSAERTKIMIKHAEKILKNSKRPPSPQALYSPPRKLVKKNTGKSEPSKSESDGKKTKSDSKGLPFKLKPISQEKLSPFKKVLVNSTSSSPAKAEKQAVWRPLFDSWKAQPPSFLVTLRRIEQFYQPAPIGEIQLIDLAKADSAVETALNNEGENSETCDSACQKMTAAAVDPAPASSASGEPSAGRPSFLVDPGPGLADISQWVESTEEVITSEFIHPCGESTVESVDNPVSSSQSEWPICPGNHSSSSVTSNHSMSSTNSLEDLQNTRAKPCSSSSESESSVNLTYTHKPVSPASDSTSLSGSTAHRTYSRVPLRFYRHHSHTSRCDLMMTCDSEEFEIDLRPENSEPPRSTIDLSLSDSFDLEMTCESFEEDYRTGDYFARHELEPVQKKVLNQRERAHQSCTQLIGNHTKLKRPFFRLDLNDPKCPPAFRQLSLKQMHHSLSTGSMKYQNGLFLAKVKDLSANTDTQTSQ